MYHSRTVKLLCIQSLSIITLRTTVGGSHRFWDFISFVWSLYPSILFVPTSARISPFGSLPPSFFFLVTTKRIENSVNWANSSSMLVWIRKHAYIHTADIRRRRTNIKWSKGFGLRFTVYRFSTCGRIFMVSINLVTVGMWPNHSHEPQQRKRDG